jgi:protein-S-isoprenylcysteine O-methyltransferase Ste14
MEPQFRSIRATGTEQKVGSAPADPLWKRISLFTYGVVAYAIFFVTFLYAAGFVANIGVPKSLDSGAQGSFGYALLINSILLAVFALQHSIMARPAFKKIWTRIVPKPVERSTYVLFASLALILLFTTWQPMGITIWNVENPVGRALLYGLFAAGWLTALYATWLINHFDLFGLRQVYLYLRGREHTALPFRTPALYRHVRHPLYLGFLFGFWATPTMTLAHLFFAIMTTGYILVAIQLEERDLVAHLGRDYADYRKRVPMLVPRLLGNSEQPNRTTITADSSAA